MDWQKIMWALLLVAMIAVIFPRARSMMKNSPKAEKGDWQSFIIPLIAVAAFIFLLVKMV